MGDVHYLSEIGFYGNLGCLDDISCSSNIFILGFVGFFEVFGGSRSTVGVWGKLSGERHVLPRMLDYSVHTALSRAFQNCG